MRSETDQSPTFDQLDEADRNILNLLQVDGGMTNVAMARRVGLAPATTLERVRKLRQAGFIRRIVALLDPVRVNRGTIAFVNISLSVHGADRLDSFQSHIRSLPEILECYHVSGESDFLLKIMVQDIGAYEDFLLHRLTSIPGVGRIHTSFVLSTVKHETQIPLQAS